MLLSPKLSEQKLLLELQEEIEALKWSTTDEINSKTKEIDFLKKELSRLQLDRDECLELQRGELTQTFDALLSSREEEFTLKENEIANQV